MFIFFTFSQVRQGCDQRDLNLLFSDALYKAVSLRLNPDGVFEILDERNEPLPISLPTGLPEKRCSELRKKAARDYLQQTEEYQRIEMKNTLEEMLRRIKYEEVGARTADS